MPVPKSVHFRSQLIDTSCEPSHAVARVWLAHTNGIPWLLRATLQCVQVVGHSQSSPIQLCRVAGTSLSRATVKTTPAASAIENLSPILPHWATSGVSVPTRLENCVNYREEFAISTKKPRHVKRSGLKSGEGEIRTPENAYALCRFSKPVRSTALAPLRTGLHPWGRAAKGQTHDSRIATV